MARLASSDLTRLVVVHRPIVMLWAPPDSAMLP